MLDCMWCGHELNGNGVCKSCAAREPEELDRDWDERVNVYRFDVEGMPE